MKLINEIAKHTAVVDWIGPNDCAIDALVFDSRKASQNNAFVAIKGTTVDGHQFIQQVVAQGCMCVVVEQKQALPATVTQIIVPSTSQALGEMAHAFYDFPSNDIQLIGVTGTNGKTTTTTLLHRLYTKLGYKVGLISTVVNLIGEEAIPATHTTPDPVSLNALLAEMVAEGCSYCFMEVSSHAVAQHRIAGLNFKV
ncbi:MAG: hypothetical protein RLZZ493_1757, partial [Bacteroidota bacterium]